MNGLNRATLSSTDCVSLMSGHGHNGAVEEGEDEDEDEDDDAGDDEADVFAIFFACSRALYLTLWSLFLAGCVFSRTLKVAPVQGSESSPVQGFISGPFASGTE